MMVTGRELVRSATPETSVAYMGSVLSFLVSADQTDGRFFSIIVEARQGNEPPPHTHLWEHEAYFILSGEAVFFVEGVSDPLLAKAGESVLLPRGRAHAVRYRTPTLRAFVTFHAGEGCRAGPNATSGDSRRVRRPTCVYRPGRTATRR